ncbi:MAG: hypothetical protein AAFX53_01910 [Bacteroidota bacterium]
MLLTGKLCFHSETGTEGGYWAFESNTPLQKGQSVYDRLHILKNGDRLKIEHPTEELIVWDGVVDLRQFDQFTEDAGGLWIHADQKGISREEWSKYFFNNYPAKLYVRNES